MAMPTSDAVAAEIVSGLAGISRTGDPSSIAQQEWALAIEKIRTMVLAASVTVTGTTASSCTAGGAAGTCTATGTLT